MDFTGYSLESLKRFIALYDSGPTQYAQAIGGLGLPTSILRDVGAAKARRDELVAMPSLPGDHYFEQLPPELVERVLYYVERGNDAAKVCRRWYDLYKSRPVLMRIRSASRFMTPLSSWTHTFKSSHLPTVVAGRDMRIWVAATGCFGHVLAIDPVTKDIQTHPRGPDDSRLIGATVDGVPIFIPSSMDDGVSFGAMLGGLVYAAAIVGAISATRLLLGREGNLSVWDTCTGTVTVILEIPTLGKYANYHSNGVGMYVIMEATGSGWFVRYATLEVIPVTYAKGGIVWSIPIPGSCMMVAYGSNTTAVNIDPDIKAVLRRSIFGTTVGGHLVVMDKGVLAPDGIHRTLTIY
jgi:hypothetical protein